MPLKEINGKKLWVEVKGSGKPVIFIHGLGSSLNYFHVQAEDLSANGFQIIRFDFEGAARSPLSGTVSIESIAKDAIAILDHFGIEVLLYNLTKVARSNLDDLESSSCRS